MPTPESTSSLDELGKQLGRQFLTTYRDNIRDNCERIFVQLHYVYDGINVCRLALERQAADADGEVANTLRVLVLAKLDKQLVHLSKLIAELGGSSDYHEGSEDEDMDMDVNINAELDLDDDQNEKEDEDDNDE